MELSGWMGRMGVGFVASERLWKAFWLLMGPHWPAVSWPPAKREASRPQVGGQFRQPPPNTHSCVCGVAGATSCILLISGFAASKWTVETARPQGPGGASKHIQVATMTSQLDLHYPWESLNKVTKRMLDRKTHTAIMKMKMFCRTIFK